MSDVHSNEHMAAWAMQELARSAATFSERVEARKVISEITKQAGVYEAALRRIANADPAYMAFDPDWAARIAQAALKGLRSAHETGASSR
jgi:predicted transcriptional regulator